MYAESGSEYIMDAGGPSNSDGHEPRQSCSETSHSTPSSWMNSPCDADTAPSILNNSKKRISSNVLCYVEAGLMLMAVYYVYNLHYNVHVKPSLLFLQTVCLHLEDDEVREEEQLAMFRNILKKLGSGNQSGEKHSL